MRDGRQDDADGDAERVAAVPAGEEQAGGEPGDVEVEPARRRLVEVVDVVMDLAVVGLVGAVILAVDVADEGQLGRAGRRHRRDDAGQHVAGEQVERAAEEGEGALAHAGDLVAHQLGVAPGEGAVEGAEFVEGVAHEIVSEMFSGDPKGMRQRAPLRVTAKHINWHQNNSPITFPLSTAMPSPWLCSLVTPTAYCTVVTRSAGLIGRSWTCSARASLEPTTCPPRTPPPATRPL